MLDKEVPIGAWATWKDQPEPKSDWEIFWAEWNQIRLHEGCDTHA